MMNRMPPAQLSTVTPQFPSSADFLLVSLVVGSLCVIERLNARLAQTEVYFDRRTTAMHPSRKKPLVTSHDESWPSR